MHLIYFALGLGHGDEVIVPAQTHMATAHAVELTGAKAVFVDVDARTGNVTAEAIAESITPRTRAIAVVHYLGAPCEMEAIASLASARNLFLLEDCALSPGARLNGVHTGLLGDAGVFSFYPVKHLTTAEGGMIILKDKQLADRLRRLRAFGVDRSHGERAVPGMYDAPELGFNYRMSEIHAALGVVQVRKLPDFLAQRKRNFIALEMALGDLPECRILPQPVNAKIESSHYCMALMLPPHLQTRRPEIMLALKDREVGTSVYYPHPVPRIAYYQSKYGYDPERFANAAAISDRMLALPVGPHLNTDDMAFIANNVRQVLEAMSS